MRRETQNVLLVLLGGALLKISFTGTYLRYVKPAHQWLLIIAGVVMLALATVAIARDLSTRRPPSPHPDEHHEPTPEELSVPPSSVVTGGRRPTHDHGHHHSARSAWLLVLPVLAVFLVAPPALGADSVQRAADTAPRPVAEEDGSALFPALPPDEILTLPLSEFSERAAWDSGNSLDGRAIRLTGFVVREGGAVYLARIAIGCCAADAYPVKVRLEGGDLARHPDDSWLQAVVELVPGSATRATDYVPAATVTSLHPVNEPEDPYEH
ncbi:TIGR03943 family putative permease subunit [Actinophytocola xanthii]|uniref:TIGR03943 family protein n=1 Tax=Actinophytocola xanthii TaxID=1912961 RepID=A0A1Q8CWN0_9PSEU|nr:TIGR03943 family protein [Actinophytocola xanthii]OLF18773.1 TIGR03943 family protein [Actinophytocola xanthii]